jgi:hypothetical protein
MISFRPRQPAQLRAPRCECGRLMVPRSGAIWEHRRRTGGNVFMLRPTPSLPAAHAVILPDMTLFLDDDAAGIDIDAIAHNFCPRPASAPAKPGRFARFVVRVRSFLRVPSHGGLAECGQIGTSTT